MKTTKAKIYTNLILTINDKKKVVYSFISNNDGTRGFRFNVVLSPRIFLRVLYHRTDYPPTNFSILPIDTQVRIFC